ncbi:MAG: hypothetical protein SFT92_06525 [Rickettsiales bacterium]|nr:hypothetical protein [Rickettsiales bacterium]
MGKSFALFIQRNGLDKERMDVLYEELAKECQKKQLNVVVLKDDERWFVFGEIDKLINLAKNQEITLPIHPIMFDHILASLEKCKKQEADRRKK